MRPVGINRAKETPQSIRFKVLRSFLVLSLGVLMLSSCGGSPSASDQKICDFVADNSLNLFVPTNLEELEKYRALSDEEKYKIRIENKWFFNYQWEENEDNSESLTYMISKDTDSQLQKSIESIEEALKPMTLAGQIYSGAQNPNEAQREQLNILLESEQKATNEYFQLALRCTELF
jgi:hypothetical protein